MVNGFILPVPVHKPNGSITHVPRPCEPAIDFKTNGFSNSKVAAEHLENRLDYDLLSRSSLFKPGTSCVLRLNDYTHTAKLWTASLSRILEISSEQFLLRKAHSCVRMFKLQK